MASAVVGALKVLLEVDSSPMNEGFGKATVTIGKFDKTAEQAGRSLQKMVEGFSGQKIVAEAASMAAAIEKVGGASALTEKELKRVAATVNEATAKLRAMGVEVPPSIAKIKGEIDALGVGAQKTQGFFASLGKAGAALGPLLPVASVVGLTTAVIGLGTRAIATADQIADLSQKTGLSAEAIQRMRHVANQTGSSIETFTQATFKLGVTIAEGSGRARAAVDGLGLSYARLQQQKPEDQFAAVIKALEGVENVQERNRLGTALFGKQFAEMSVAVASGYTKLADAAEVSSDRQIKALGDAADAWQGFTDKVNALTITVLGEVIRTTGGIIDAFQNLSKIEPVLLLGLASLLGKSPAEMLVAIGQGMADLGDRAQESGTKATAAAAGFASYGDELQSARRALLDLTAKQKDEIDAAIKLKKSNEEIAATFNLSTEAVQLYRDQMEKTPASTKKASDAIEKAAKAQRDYNNWIGVRYIEAEEARQNAAEKSETQLRAFYNWLGQRRMEDDEAMLNSIRILATYSQAWVPLKSAIEQTLPKMEDATQKQKRLAQASQDTSTSLRNLAQGFANLAQISGEGGLGQTLQQIGQLVAGLSLARDGMDGFIKGFEQFKSGNLTAGFASMASGIMGVVAAMEQATRGTNKWMAALGGAAVGFSVGGIFGAIGGAILGLARSSKAAGKEQEKIAEEAAKARAELMKQFEAMKKRADEMSKLIALVGQTEAIAKMFAEAKTAEDVAAIAKELERITEEGVKINDEFRDLFDLIETSGYAIPQEMQDFLSSFMDLLDPANQAKLQSLFGMMSGQEVPWEKMQAAAEKFGIDIGSLGQKFQAGKLKASATDIINAFELLTKNGADVGGVLFGMQDEISKLVQDAKKFKTEIPAQMQPWIEELRRAGLLVDENGEKIEDLSDVKFGAPIVSEFDKVILKIGELIERFGDLIAVISGVPSPDIKVPSAPAPAPGSAPGGDYRSFPIPEQPVPFASGGIVTRRTYAVLGESGPEMVVPLRRYANPSAVPIPNIGSLVPDLGKMPSDMHGGPGDYRSDFREAIGEMREEMKGWFETFTDAIALTLRDARSGAY